ncbi:MAG: hypothetical protein ACOCQD_01000 [archaeon]
MIIKKKFELGTGGVVPNIVTMPKSTLKAFSFNKGELEYLQSAALTYSRSKPQEGSKLVEKYYKSCVLVKMPTYPLPGFVTNKGVPVCNLDILGGTLLTDYSSSDIFSIYLYSILLNIYYKNPKRDPHIEEHISAFFFAILMRMYGKKSGLLGAYQKMIPQLRFLIQLYVRRGMIGTTETVDKSINDISRNLYMDPSKMNLNFDFTSTIDFLRSINTNGIISISEVKFTSDVVSRAGISSLPIFEDIGRLYATILSSRVPANTVFSSVWKKMHEKIFNKLSEFAFRKAT